MTNTVKIKKPLSIGDYVCNVTKKWKNGEFIYHYGPIGQIIEIRKTSIRFSVENSDWIRRTSINRCRKLSISEVMEMTLEK